MHRLSEFQLKVERRQMPLGDFLFVLKPKLSNEEIFANYAQLERHLIKFEGGKIPALVSKTQLEMVFDLIVERKKISDFCSSLQDGRFQNQLNRLETSHFSRIVYLIEGEFRPFIRSKLIRRHGQQRIL